MKDLYFPHFQPIINLNDGKIFAYEALARTKKNNQITSAGDIFHNNKYPVNEVIEIDRQIRRTALEQLRHNPQVDLMTLNISPLWVDRLADNELAPTLRMLDELAIDPQKIVMEITELAGDIEKLRRITREYQAHGLKIAVDDFGAGASQIDRILALEPDIIKLDMHLLKAATKGQAEANIALSFATLSQRSDSIMICEGVETEEEFHFSIECGADCIQGWIFEPALENFIDPKSSVEKTMRLKNSYLKRKSHRYEEAHNHQKQFSEYVKTSCQFIQQHGNDALITQTDDINKMQQLGLLRYYVCDTNATQISPNYHVNRNGISKEMDVLHCNWSHRPFFPLLLGIRKASNTQILVSEPYKDRSLGKMCRTFAAFISENMILLMDVLIEDMILFGPETTELSLPRPAPQSSLMKLKLA